ncbi:S-locus-specific glycoprotein [Acorus calamus]|uniref:S-locus-specific glycoprotein n=1 Tax=Acorus calamus TaxID=4465 RepID=A0AAV9C7A9_ACOCL|nr:S-locus-specific glycoprotein [Acorus calamus]
MSDQWLILLLLLLSLLSTFTAPSTAGDSMTATDTLSDGGGTLVSSNELFELGFFNPNNSNNNNRYLGICNWVLREAKGGCVRNTKLGCGEGGDDGFLKLNEVKLPDASNAMVNETMGARRVREEVIDGLLVHRVRDREYY